MSRTMEHLRGLVGAVLDPRSPETSRPRHARTLSEAMNDYRDAFAAAAWVLDGGEALDVLRVARSSDSEVRRDAADRQQMRMNLRAVDVGLGFTSETILPGAVSTNLEDAAPLIRRFSRRLVAAQTNQLIVPGLAAVDDAVIDPVLPMVSGQQVHVDPLTGQQWHYSAVLANVAKQLVDFAGATASALVDSAMRDAVDLAAEEHVVAELEAGAVSAASPGGPGGPLADAEGQAAAAGRGPCAFVLCHPVRWPHLRAELAEQWTSQQPMPVPIVSAGASENVVTFVGPRAIEVLTDDVQVFQVDEPGAFGQLVSMHRPFRLVKRNLAAVVKTS